LNNSLLERYSLFTTSVESYTCGFTHQSWRRNFLIRNCCCLSTRQLQKLSMKKPELERRTWLRSTMSLRKRWESNMSLQTSYCKSCFRDKPTLSCTPYLFSLFSFSLKFLCLTTSEPFVLLLILILHLSSCSCAWVIWSLVLVVALSNCNLILHFSELSLKVQGGHDYFRFVEGTCIIALCLSSLSLSLSLSLFLTAAFRF